MFGKRLSRNSDLIFGLKTPKFNMTLKKVVPKSALSYDFDILRLSKVICQKSAEIGPLRKSLKLRFKTRNWVLLVHCRRERLR